MSNGAHEALAAHENFVRNRVKAGDRIGIHYGIGPVFHLVCCGWTDDFLRARDKAGRVCKFSPRRVSHINGTAVADLLAEAQANDEMPARGRA